MTLPQLQTIIVNGVARTYRATNLAAGRPAVFILHGSGSQSVSIPLTTHFDATAMQYNIGAVYPDAIAGEWNDLSATSLSDSDDNGFLLALRQQLITAGLVDPKNISIGGMSGGGGMAAELFQLHPEFFKGLYMVSSGTTNDNIASHPAKLIGKRIIQFRNTADTIWRYNGGLKFPPAPAEATWWASQLSIPLVPIVTILPPASPDDGTVVTVSEYNRPPNSKYTFVSTLGAGHTWPGGSMPSGLGVTSTVVDASNIIAASIVADPLFGASGSAGAVPIIDFQAGSFTQLTQDTDADLRFQLYDLRGQPLNVDSVASIEWEMQHSLGFYPNTLRKSLDAETISFDDPTNGIGIIHLTALDLHQTRGVYYVEMRVVDINGHVSHQNQGFVKITPVGVTH